MESTAGYFFEYRTSTRLLRVSRDQSEDGSNIEITLFKFANSERYLNQSVSVPEHHFTEVMDSCTLDSDILKVISEGKFNSEGRIVVNFNACERMRVDSKNCEVIRDIKGNNLFHLCCSLLLGVTSFKTVYGWLDVSNRIDR